MLTRRRFLLHVPAGLSCVATAPAQNTLRIRHVDIIHHSHTDVGFTDLPSVCRDMQKRFLDAALDACLNDQRFHWTAEAMLTVDDWWRASAPARRNQLLRVVRAGQMDIMALPFNQAPFLNALQWQQMLSWVTETLWRALSPRAAMQNDVNGFPRAGALRLLDKGIRHLLMGINADSGGPPFRRPSAFWWKMPDGRKLFVWLGDHYGTAYGFFEAKSWIRQQPRGAETAFRAPRAGDFHRTDEASLRAAHRHFVSRLERLEGEGYEFERLILSCTNQWRYDNDPPFPPLSGFIEAWNRLGLQPALRFTTATDAVLAMERAVGSRAPVREGEWTDWWANGDASGPRELAASRAAKRCLAAARSPVWGPMPAEAHPHLENILKDLCLFDEHTWGANISISQPDSLQTIGQYTEKSLLAYRPMGHAEWLLGRRARTKLDPGPEGFYVANTAREAFTGWVSFAGAALRGEFRSLEDPRTGKRIALHREQGNAARIWVEDLPPASVAALRLSTAVVEEPAPRHQPSVETNASGWPVSAAWPSMERPLFSGEMGHFLSIAVVPPANRATIAEMHRTADPAKREELRKKAFRQEPAAYGKTLLEETAYTLVYTQPIEHPRLAGAQRRLELWRRQPRAQVTMRFDRTSSTAPEVFYMAFALPVQGVLPVFSNGGVPFVPYREQLEGSCRDYYAIDGWAHYAASAGHWLWVTRDAPLVAVGGPHTVARRTTPPADTHRLLAMVFDNFWHTNFVANSHGGMEFQFELAWRNTMPAPDELAETLVSEPVILINPSARESPELMKNLFRP